MATATVPATSTTRPRKLAASRKSTRKAKSVQSAIVAKRISGASKAQIARDLGLAVNTVTNIVELNAVDSAIEQYRKDAIALAPLAITAVHDDLLVPGNGMLGLRVLESVGVLGENAIDAQRRMNVRAAGSINVLVQPGASATVVHTDATTVQRADDSAKVINVGATVQPDDSNAKVTLDNATVQPRNGNATVNCDAGACNAPSPTAAVPPPAGKHPK